MEHARNGDRLLVDKVTFRAAQGIVGAYKGPEDFLLQKPGQTVAHPYQRYTLRQPKGEPHRAGSRRTCGADQRVRRSRVHQLQSPRSRMVEAAAQAAGAVPQHWSLHGVGRHGDCRRRQLADRDRRCARRGSRRGVARQP